jgi:hypothetical protein
MIPPTDMVELGKNKKNACVRYLLLCSKKLLKKSPAGYTIV